LTLAMFTWSSGKEVSLSDVKFMQWWTELQWL